MQELSPPPLSVTVEHAGNHQPPELGRSRKFIGASDKQVGSCWTVVFDPASFCKG
jgi:hypothetical protein